MPPEGGARGGRAGAPVRCDGAAAGIVVELFAQLALEVGVGLLEVVVLLAQLGELAVLFSVEYSDSSSSLERVEVGAPTAERGTIQFS